MLDPGWEGAVSRTPQYGLLSVLSLRLWTC